MPFLNKKAGCRDWIRTRIKEEPLSLADGAVIVRQSNQWILMAPAPNTVLNGMPLVTGIRILKHGDEFFLGDCCYLFDGIDPPEILPFPGTPEQQRCPRCRTELALSVPSACCVCGLWYHQDPASGLTCFAYDDQARCVSCRRPTQLDAVEQLDPED